MSWISFTMAKANLPRATARNPAFSWARTARVIGWSKIQKGLRGGIFVDRAQALKYAMHEITDRMQAVIMVPGILELDMSGPNLAMARARTDRSVQRRVA